MDEAQIYDKLESLRESYLDDSPMPNNEADIELDGRKFTQRVWAEPHENGKLVVFMLESDKAVYSNAFCLGLKINEDGAAENLSNEQLWDIGIP